MPIEVLRLGLQESAWYFQGDGEGVRQEVHSLIQGLDPEMEKGRWPQQWGIRSFVRDGQGCWEDSQAHSVLAESF